MRVENGPGANYDNIVLESAPRGYWPLTDSSGSSTVVDLTANRFGLTGRNGTLTLGGTLGVDGPPVGGSAWEADGDSYITLASNPINGKIAGLMIAGWYYYPGGNQKGVFFVAGASVGGGGGCGAAIGGTDGTNVGVNLLLYVAGATWVDTGYDFSATGWYHIAVRRRSNAEWLVYVNGRAVLSSTQAMTSMQNSFAIGANAAGAGPLSSGNRIARVGVWALDTASSDGADEYVEGHVEHLATLHRLAWWRP